MSLGESTLHDWPRRSARHKYLTPDLSLDTTNPTVTLFKDFLIV